MAEVVYVVVRRNVDMKDYMVEITGIFKSEHEAKDHRQYMYDRWSVDTEVLTYQLLDTVTIGEK
jgi:hypothetical protein